MKPHVSKFCWIADVMTAARFFLASVIFAGTMMGNLSPFAVLALFCAGEVFDALDGVWARHFLHPSWADELPFRKYASLLDKAADVTLFASAIFYVARRIDGQIIVVFAIFALLALMVELAKKGIERRFGKETRRRVVIFRRMIYVYAVLYVAEILFSVTALFRLVPSEVWAVSSYFAFVVPPVLVARMPLRATIALEVLLNLVYIRALFSVPVHMQSEWWRMKAMALLPILAIVIGRKLKPDRASEENTPTPRAEDVQA